MAMTPQTEINKPHYFRNEDGSLKLFDPTEGLYSDEPAKDYQEQIAVKAKIRVDTKLAIVSIPATRAILIEFPTDVLMEQLDYLAVQCGKSLVKREQL